MRDYLSTHWYISIHFEFYDAEGHVRSYPWRNAPEHILNAAEIKQPFCLRVGGWIFRIRKSEFESKFHILSNDDNSDSVVSGWSSSSLSSTADLSQEFTCLLTGIKMVRGTFTGIILRKFADYYERVGMISLKSDGGDLAADFQIPKRQPPVHFRRQEVSIR